MRRPPEPNSDQLALIAQADLDRLVRKVMAPALAELQSVHVPTATGSVDEETFFKTAAAATHNALCLEARKAFALMLGATFERQVRLWLARGAPEREPDVQCAFFDRLFELVLELKGVDATALRQWPDLVELWEVVSAIRHGDGRATKKLAKIAPHLWPTAGSAPNFDGLEIGDADIQRYYVGTMVFWGAVGATPPFGISA